jgi:hypothetical protein
MARFPGGSAALAAALLVTLAGSAQAQGGWRQWDVRLRDGTWIVASPLGAPSDTSISRSVGGYDRIEDAIGRGRIDYMAAHDPRVLDEQKPAPPAPEGRSCEDVLVYWDGHRTIGRVHLTQVRWSEGVVTQNGVEVDLQGVAYIKFANTWRWLCIRSGD